MSHDMPAAANTLNVSGLPTFVDPLPLPMVAKPSGLRSLPSSPRTKLPYYRLAARPVEVKVHRDLKPTRFWSYGPSVPGPTLELRSGEEVLVEWANELPEQHFLPIDYRLHGADHGNPQVRIVSHLHGARVPADSDGYPEDWFTPGKSRALSLSQPAGRSHALVSRSRHGHQSAERLCRTCSAPHSFATASKTS